MLVNNVQGDYYSTPYINATSIKAGANSIRHMVWLINHPLEEPSVAMIKGSKFHSYIWDRDSFNKEYQVCDLDFRTKDGKAFLQANNITQANIVRTAELEELEQAYRNIVNHPEAKYIALNSKLEVEKPIYWQESKLDNALCKAKLDGITDEAIIEYKTTSNLNSFVFSAQRLHYNLQFAWYYKAAIELDGKERPVFVVVQESKPPFDVAVYKVETYQLKEWLQECYQIVDQYLRVKDKPIEQVQGAYPDLMRFELPNYAEEDDLEVEI